MWASSPTRQTVDGGGELVDYKELADAELLNVVELFSDICETVSESMDTAKEFLELGDAEQAIEVIEHNKKVLADEACSAKRIAVSYREIIEADQRIEDANEQRRKYDKRTERVFAFACGSGFTALLWLLVWLLR